MTPDQERELARQQRTERAITTSLDGARIANRHHKSGPDLRKQEFIDEFIMQRRIDEYPFEAADILDEAQAVHQQQALGCLLDEADVLNDIQAAQLQSAVASTQPHPNPDYDPEYVYDPAKVTIDEAMKREASRAFRLYGDPKHVDPGVLAHELLSSEQGDELRRIRDLPLPDVELDMILAHLESLGYDLDKRLSASLARRTFMVVLNRRWFRNDGKHKAKTEAPARA